MSITHVGTMGRLPRAIRDQPGHRLAVTMQLGGKWLRSRFLRKARSEVRAYPSWICKRRTTKSLRKKIEPTRPIQLHGYGLKDGASAASLALWLNALPEVQAALPLGQASRSLAKPIEAY